MSKLDLKCTLNQLNAHCPEDRAVWFTNIEINYSAKERKYLVLVVLKEGADTHVFKGRDSGVSEAVQQAYDSAIAFISKVS